MANEIVRIDSENLGTEHYGIAGSPRKIVAHTYDTASRLTAMTYNGNQQAGNVVYNASDQTTQMKVGAAGTNQVTEDYTFDPQTGLLTNQKATKNVSTTLIDLTYQYNRGGSVGSLNGKTGHLTKIIDNLNTNKNREYEFDVLGRLTKAKGGPTGNLWDQTYTYDRYGNRTNVQANGVAADSSPIPIDGIPNLAYDNTSNRITTTGYQYDVNGNVIRSLAEDGSTWVKYEYDAANRLNIIRKDDSNQTQLERLQYDSTNARVQSHDPALDRYKGFLNTGGTTLAEFTEFIVGVPTWTKSYTYLGGSQLATITPVSGSENIEFNHPDRLGTKTVTNQSAGTSSEQAHLPFGRKLDAESTLQTNNKRFTSYDRSEKTSLDYAVNRTYDSKLGRFTQVDPIGMSAASLAAPQTLNMYSYCGNDPVNFTDPSGLFWGFFKKLFKWIMVAVAVVVAIMTIVAAPFTIAGILGMISAASGAASSVLGALGYNKAAMIFGLIAVATGFGSLIAGQIASSQAAAAAAARTPGSITLANTAKLASEALKTYKDAAMFGILSGVGAIANNLNGDRKKRKKYSTAQRAAIAILQEINARSIRINREMAGFICKIKDGVFTSTVPVVLGPSGGSIPNTCPKNSQLAGLYHTHARWTDNAVVGGTDWNENFSGLPLPGNTIGGDVASATSNNLSSWLATPSGNVMRYSRNPTGWQVATVGRTRIK